MGTIHSIDYKVAAAQILTPLAPAAGAQYDLALPIGSRFHILSVHCVFQTSVAVANRFIRLTVTQAFIPIVNLPFYPAIPASQALLLSWTAGNSNAPIALHPSLINDTGMGPDIMIGELMNLQINVVNIQAADQIANIRILYRHWPRPAHVY